GLLIRTGLVVVVLKTGGGLLGLVGADTATGALIFVASFFCARHVYPKLSLRLVSAKIQRLREMWRFGTVTFITRSASEVVYQSDQVILMAFIGPRAVAVYGVANMLVLYAQRAVEQLAAVLDPSVMKSGGVGDFASLRKTFTWYPRVAFFIGIPLYVGFIVFGDIFLRLWVGVEFIESVLVLKILSLAELASLFAGMGGSVLFSLGRLRFNLICSSAEATVNLALTLSLVGWAAMGTMGAAIGTLVATVAFRGILHPLYSTRAVQMTYKSYFLAIGPRAIGGAILAYVIFTVIRITFEPHEWFAFAWTVAASSLIYAVLGAITIFGWQGAGHLIDSVLPLKRRIS
ncbi:MAG: oligosaccharide flippase family protein, partial [Gemmatimonadota bacterium]|nr:oligosaccharide flippase family protein [Gemmatimonadota bacterium]